MDPMFALGAPGRVAFFARLAPADVAANRDAGKTVIPVDTVPTGPYIISTSGKLVAAIAPTAVAMQDLTTAAQLPVTIPAPAGSTWTVKGLSYAGPQTINFGSAGTYPLLFTDAWTGSAMVTVLSATDYETYLLGLVDDQRETLMMTYLTPGGAKKTEYAEKSLEVRDYRNTLISVITALSVADLNTRFPWAMEEVSVSGVTLAAAIALFEAGAKKARPAKRIAALAQKYKRAIRAAPSSATKLAAYKAINWTA
jgi:hypothetical protein